VDRQAFIDRFGAGRGSRIWQALQEAAWILPEKGGLVGRVQRRGTYGSQHFSGPLAPFADQALKAGIMDILDARAVLVVFGDNANLTASLAKAVGALLRPGIKDSAAAARLRGEMELFIEAQTEGYRRLYDQASGTIAFGWDAGRGRPMGWDDGGGNWVAGRMDYLVSEFRGPLVFSVLRFGIPREALVQAGFKIKPYRSARGDAIYSLCAWDGSAFQLFGFSLFMAELESPGWRACLERAVAIEIDFSTGNSLPGFLSESYSGNGAEYTRFIGIADIAVTDKPLITHAPSLYTLGVAWTIAPEKMAPFIRSQHSVIKTLLTGHGPWEGYDTRRQEPIR
jgi:hypothetical protein